MILSLILCIIKSHIKEKTAQNKDGVNVVLFSQIRPFVRFARYLSLTFSSEYACTLPYDARIFYTERGFGRIKVGDTVYEMPKGALLYLNAGCSYQLLPCDAVYLALNFDFTDAHSDQTVPIGPVNEQYAHQFAPIERVSFSDVACFEEHLFLEQYPQAGESLRSILSEYEKKLPCHQLRLSAQMVTLLVKMMRRQERMRQQTSGLNLEDVVEYIQNNYRQELTNEQLARRFHFHPNYISAEFRRYLGKPLHRYLLELRIQKAMSLLEDENRSLTEIAQEVGFENSNYFSRYFKKTVGLTPSQYRKNQ